MTPTLDNVLRVLANRERRKLLLALADHNSQLDNSFDYLDDVRFDSRKTYEKIHIRMYHIHLPKLEEGGFIKWQEGDQVITKGRNFDVIRSLLQVIEDEAEEVGVIDGL